MDINFWDYLSFAVFAVIFSIVLYRNLSAAEELKKFGREDMARLFTIATLVIVSIPIILLVGVIVELVLEGK